MFLMLKFQKSLHCWCRAGALWFTSLFGADAEVSETTSLLDASETGVRICFTLCVSDLETTYQLCFRNWSSWTYSFTLWCFWCWSLRDHFTAGSFERICFKTLWCFWNWSHRSSLHCLMVRKLGLMNLIFGVSETEVSETGLLTGFGSGFCWRSCWDKPNNRRPYCQSILLVNLDFSIALCYLKVLVIIWDCQGVQWFIIVNIDLDCSRTYWKSIAPTMEVIEVISCPWT